MAEIPELKKGTVLWQDMEDAFTKCKLLAVSGNIDLDAASTLIGEMTTSLNALTISLNALTETNGTIDTLTDRVDVLEAAKVVYLTQSEYEALPAYDDNTLYNILAEEGQVVMEIYLTQAQYDALEVYDDTTIYNIFEASVS